MPTYYAQNTWQQQQNCQIPVHGRPPVVPSTNDAYNWDLYHNDLRMFGTLQRQLAQQNAQQQSETPQLFMHTDPTTNMQQVVQVVMAKDNSGNMVQTLMPVDRNIQQPKAQQAMAYKCTTNPKTMTNSISNQTSVNANKANRAPQEVKPVKPKYRTGYKDSDELLEMMEWLLKGNDMPVLQGWDDDYIPFERMEKALGMKDLKEKLCCGMFHPYENLKGKTMSWQFWWKANLYYHDGHSWEVKLCKKNHSNIEKVDRLVVKRTENGYYDHFFFDYGCRVLHENAESVFDKMCKLAETAKTLPPKANDSSEDTPKKKRVRPSKKKNKKY